MQNEPRHDDLRRPSWSVPPTATAVASWLCGFETVRGLVACACPPRQIRNHLLLVDIGIWLLIILAAILMWNAI